MIQTPRVLGNAFEIASRPDSGRGGALWALDPDPRHLDSNVIRIPAGDRIEPHDGPDLDVLWLILAGAGVVESGPETIEVSAGDLIWLPRRSPRSVVAGPGGLTYLTVHGRKPPLSIGGPRH